MRSLTRKILLTYLAGAASLTGAMTAANAIENGKPDNAYVNVGAVGFDVDGPMGDSPYGICSGFVISDRAFVTAAHCIETGIFFGAKSWAVAPESGSEEYPVILPGIFTGGNIMDFPMQVDTIPAIAVQLHPLYDRDTHENDVAVLEFPSGTFNVAPVRLVRPGLLRLLKRLRILERLAVGVVGYGADGFDIEELGFSMPGYRQRGFTSIADMTRTRLTLEPTPVLDSSLLPGDSGSPQFVLGRAVSLSSIPGFGEQRLDTPAVRWFLEPYIRH